MLGTLVLNPFWLGLLIILGSGILNASFALPMKFTRSWKWENTWLLFTTLALLVLPVVLASAMVPDLRNVYSSLPARQLLPGLVFGFLWGMAQVTFGLAIAAVGMAMAFAIVVGMCAVLGSLIPMAVLHPAELPGPVGILLLASAVVLTSGLVIYGKAARQREADSGGSPELRGARFRKGLALCLFTGALGGMINLGFAFSGAISDQAVKQGATPGSATLAVWVVVLSAGYVPNLLYTSYLLRKNRTAALFLHSPGREGALVVAMACLWLSGTLGYGWGAAKIGTFGTSIGFAVYMIMLLLWSTTLGVLTGEWRQAKRQTLARMRMGLAVILVSVLILSATGLL